MPIPDSKFGVGCYLFNYHAGVGSLNSLHFMSSAAYEIMQDPLNQHHLMTGLQLGFIQKSISYDELTFDNQYTTLNGGSFDKNISPGEYFSRTTKFMLDANFGIHYYNIDKFSIFSKNVNPFGYIKPYYAGFSMFHLFEPNESFFNSGDAPIPRRFVLYGGMMWRITSEIYAEPMLMTQWQAWHNEFVFG